MVKPNTHTKQKFLVAFANMCEFYEMYVLMHCTFLLKDHWLQGASEKLLENVTIVGLTIFPAIGVFFWSFYGDKRGRREVLLSSSLVVLFCSIALACLPDYHILGVWCLPLFLLLRVTQSIAMAGEPIAAKIYAIENNYTANEAKPWWIQMMTNGQDIGGFLGCLMGLLAYVLQDTYDWAWRIPFIFGIIPAFSALLLRWTLLETQEYSTFKTNSNIVGHYLKEKFLTKYLNRNALAYVMLCIYFAGCFQYLYKYTTPTVMKACKILGDDAVLKFNMINIVAVMILLSIVSGLTTLRKWNVRKVQLTLFAISFIGLVALRNIDITLPANLPYISMIMWAVEVGATWNVLYAAIINAFPMSKRFRYMGLGWAVSLCISWAIFNVVISPLFKTHGIDAVNGVMFILWSISFIGILLHYGEMSHPKKWIKERNEFFTDPKNIKANAQHIQGLIGKKIT